MGNTNRQNQLKGGNEILIEFLTPEQKLKKEKALLKVQVEDEKEAEDMDVEIINDFKQFYKVDYRKVLYTDKDIVSYDILFDQIMKPTKECPNDLLEVTNFFQQEVRSFQIYFNNREVTKTGQEYVFSKNSMEPLNVEFIYKRKHWAEKIVHRISTVGQVIKKHIGTIAKVFQITTVAYPLFKNPLLMPALKTLNTIQKGMGIQRNKLNQKVVGGVVQSVVPAVSNAASTLGPTLMTPKGIAVMLGLYFGRGIVFFAVKMVLIMLFPFLSPFLWLFGV